MWICYSCPAQWWSLSPLGLVVPLPSAQKTFSSASAALGWWGQVGPCAGLNWGVLGALEDSSLELAELGGLLRTQKVLLQRGCFYQQLS